MVKNRESIFNPTLQKVVERKIRKAEKVGI